MRNQPKPRAAAETDTKTRQIEEFYDPLQRTVPIKPLAAPNNNYCVTLFNDDEEDSDFIVSSPEWTQRQPKAEPRASQEDPFLQKILANSKGGSRPRRREAVQVKTVTDLQPFCFNNSVVLKYPQTPHFKTQLQSPFCKFNAQHRLHIETLQRKTIKADFTPLPLDADPLQFTSEPLRYFLGIATTLREKECPNAARAVLRLALYVEPFNDKAWRRCIEAEEQAGNVSRAFVLSKTAFLFTQQQQFARSYLSSGEKCGVPLCEMRGLLSSAESPESLEKVVLVEVGKLCLKHEPVWRGLRVLHQVCQWNEFRLPVCTLIIFLARLLENLGQRQKGLMLLRRSFGRGMSKLEVYTTYLEMRVREEPILKEALIREVLDYADFISSENRYRLYLQIAELLFRRGDGRYKEYVQHAFEATRRFCAAGTGTNKTLRQIYYTVLKWKHLCPPSLPSDNSLIECNRYEFIEHGSLKQYDFGDWKYYLHYGLTKQSDVLLQAAKKWNYTGRLIAEWIHSLRTQLSPREVLRLWRERVEEVPKSGELWCEGGRIYAQLHEYESAGKCFRAAMHFTPQFGDSFIEQLRLHLMRGQLLEAHRLKKLTLVSEPFYGHVWSFLRESSPAQPKLCLNDMWELAVREINSSLYQDNIQMARAPDPSTRRLTAYAPYNQAFLNPDTPHLRRQLFASYEQLDNKN